MTAGQALRTARQSKGMTLRKVSDEIGLSQSFISEVELGSRAIGEKALSLWCKVIGTDDAEIACLADCVPMDIRKWMLADPNRIRAVRDVMKRGTKVMR